jgi:two-component system response regulator PilR (NtrC family)
MPPLRERRKDIPVLAEHFLRKFTLTMGKNIKSISKEALRVLVNYDFPGNVRELENLIERAVALEVQPTILPESLPQKLIQTASAKGSLAPVAPMVSAGVPSPASSAGPAAPFDLEKGVEEFERAHILKALEKANGVKKRAAGLLGISFRSLRYRIEKYGIDDPNPEENE